MATQTSEVTTMKITPRSVPTYPRPITTSHTDITTYGLMSDTAAVTSAEPILARATGRGPVSQNSLTPGAVAGIVTSVALALLNIIQCLGHVILWRRRKRNERSDQSIQAVAKEQARTTDLTSKGYPMANTAASRNYGDNYMFLVKSEYIDGSAMSEVNEDRNGYQELRSAETPSSDEYSYAYASAGGRKATVEPGEQDKKHKSDVYELQHMYSNVLQ
ncbi:uncharacterized protein LOC106175236 [Lingula anatina]|uniref:Uncharacterized protein LOC106175236 n=1 Tax=Lingula anatina TaxID=7574 RepID=A0A1S3JQE3_LINAN|nr:uncharacterized protein LOC106175236 [Lingula anatina]|eukprot:XP_013412598.1 uncharacterized protein LOC106175236 [Lingula anatina]